MSVPFSQSARGGQKMSTSSVSSSASAECGRCRGNDEHLTRAHHDFLRAVLTEVEAQRALDDPRDLLVLVRVLRDDAAPIEVDLGEHHALARDEPARELWGDLLARKVFPTEVAGDG